MKIIGLRIDNQTRDLQNKEQEC